ncbi:MAG: MBL fold metallo-hydrolase [Anaerolineales bacterium]
MSELLLLGTGASLTDGSREPTMLAVRGAATTTLIDCGANPVRQLQRLGVPLGSIDRLILTHSHPDHTSGFPLLVEMLWLAGRRAPLPVHGPADTVDLMRRVFGQWDTSGWTGLFEIEWHVVALEMGAPVAQTDEFVITAAPGHHSVPVMGVRFEGARGGAVMAYSADGEPSEGVRRLAENADLLVHEATGEFRFHSTAEAAAKLAREAGAKRLVLVHLAPLANDLEAQRRAASGIFGGEVRMGEDLDRITVEAAGGST